MSPTRGQRVSARTHASSTASRATSASPIASISEATRRGCSRTYQTSNSSPASATDISRHTEAEMLGRPAKKGRRQRSDRRGAERGVDPKKGRRQRSDRRGAERGVDPKKGRRQRSDRRGAERG